MQISRSLFWLPAATSPGLGESPSSGWREFISSTCQLVRHCPNPKGPWSGTGLPVEPSVPVGSGSRPVPALGACSCCSLAAFLGPLQELEY